MNSDKKTFEDGASNDDCAEIQNPVRRDLSKISKLSIINGVINKMSKMDIVTELRSLRLNTNGNKEVTTRRLKEFYRKERMPPPPQKTVYSKSTFHPYPQPAFKYICVIDFEATCDESNRNYEHEIIEFPVILIDTNSKEVIDEFHSYCRPKLNPTLTAFCTELTNITQEQVDKADDFETVLSNFKTWLSKYTDDDLNEVAILTDGPWDMGKFMATQCKRSDVDMPALTKKWINIRKAFNHYYKCKTRGIVPMLDSLGLTFEGHLHSGLDDTRNIARIALHMLHDGVRLRINENLTEYTRRQMLKFNDMPFSTSPYKSSELD